MKIMHLINDGTPNQINRALMQASSGPLTLYLSPGVYREKIKITRSHLTLIGASAASTRIEYGDYAKMKDENGQEFTTFKTYTVMVLAPDVTLAHLTIANTAGKGELKGQAVALHVMSDRVHVKHCVLTAYQDTLFTGPYPDDLVKRYEGFLPDDERLSLFPARQYYEACTIEGDVDFIFGAGNALFDRCILVSKAKDSLIEGYVSAPATPEDQEHGHTFYQCVFTGSAKDNSVYLARPWRDYGKTRLIDCILGPHIKREGFHHWEGTNRQLTCRFEEINSTGLGSSQAREPYVKVLHNALIQFDIASILGDFSPKKA